MALHESAEMYLETIYVLAKQKSTVRSVDVAEALNYSKPSVSRAVGLLKNGGYLTVEKDGFLRLTELGTEIGQKIYERHTLLENFLINMGVSPAVAEEDACKMEHAISDETFYAIQKFVQNMK
ncbi:MAG: metal-dependent transcriptional regulator [Oscillospiraceae bacterium]|nr:metal-dependent transcriptional regulator [Oscillospiraceae bacterium]